MKRRGPIAVLSLSRSRVREIEALRDRILRGLGTDEALIAEPVLDWSHALHWRKPLRLEEINQMAETPEVKARPGRP